MPTAAATPFTKVVLPAPRSPSSATNALAGRTDASRLANHPGRSGRPQLTSRSSAGNRLRTCHWPNYLWNKARYDAFAARQFPGFPMRRAFFVETDTTLSVFAAWQDRIAEDLRHETTHGYVHAVVPTIPLWLDEGVAEFFDLPRSEQGVQAAHVAYLSGRLLEGTWRPDIDRMEALASAGDLSQDHYAEAWCWTHWMLHTTLQRCRLLQDYLADVRRASQTAPLSARLRHAEGLGTDLSATLRSHVETLMPPPRL